MKISDIPNFRIWLKAMYTMDKRLTGADFNSLYNLYKRSK